MIARPGANPRLETIEYVTQALQAADGPVSRNRLLYTMAEWGHSMNRQSLNAALAFLDSMGKIAEGSKGIVWVPEASPQLRKIVREGRDL